MSRVRVNPGVGYTFFGGPEGVAFDIQGSNATAIQHPFKVKLKKVDGVLKTFVRAGTVNNVVPKISSKFLDDPTVDGVTTSDDDGTMDVLLKVSKGASPVFFPDTAVIEVSSRPIPADTDSDGYLVLASISFNEGKATIFQHIYSSLICARAKPGSAAAIYLFSSR